LSTLRINLNRLAISLQQFRHLAARSEPFEAFSSQSNLLVLASVISDFVFGDSSFACKESAAIYEDLTRLYYKRLAALRGGDGYHEERAEYERYSGLSLEALRIERGTAIRCAMRGESMMRFCVVSNSS